MSTWLKRHPDAVSDHRWVDHPLRRERGARRSRGQPQRQGELRAQLSVALPPVHVAVDGPTRLTYVEVLPDETGPSCAGFLTRAGAFYADYGITVQRMMTDNAFAYRRSRAFADAATGLGAVQRFIRPRCPWTNGKAERFNRTLTVECLRRGL